LLDLRTFFLRAAVRRSVADLLPVDFFSRVVFFFVAMRRVYQVRSAHSRHGRSETLSVKRPVERQIL
jgi:hypothetical protein